MLTTARRQLAPIALDWDLLALDPDAARSRPLLADLVTVPAGGGDTDDLVKKVFAAATGPSAPSGSRPMCGPGSARSPAARWTCSPPRP
ncbi:hypothetical protein O1M54_46285 [Streptomyces diastatochromogenes]|nr:hypothetical protein [Streptomyces diastatochromogenes]